MRLEPLERPGSILGYILSRGMRKMLGKPLTSTRIAHARLPSMWWILAAFTRVESSYTIDRVLALLIHTRASMHNNCALCQDISRAIAVRGQLGLERFNALWDWPNSNQFSEAERAALSYIDAINNRDDDATGQAFQALRDHFTDRQIVEITSQNAIANFYNLINIPLAPEAEGLEELALAQTSTR